MCLTELIEKKELCKTARNNLAKGIGWKIFAKEGNNLYSWIFSDLCPKYKINKWYHADNSTLYTTYNQRYQSGFHTYLRKKDAIKFISELNFLASEYQIMKVKFKNINCIGKQHHNYNYDRLNLVPFSYISDVVVVKNILLLPNQ